RRQTWAPLRTPTLARSMALLQEPSSEVRLLQSLRVTQTTAILDLRSAPSSPSDSAVFITLALVARYGTILISSRRPLSQFVSRIDYLLSRLPTHERVNLFREGRVKHELG